MFFCVFYCVFQFSQVIDSHVDFAYRPIQLYPPAEIRGVARSAIRNNLLRQ